jgi:CubicO group peptidase (beta-lactamase class C family)
LLPLAGLLVLALALVLGGIRSAKSDVSPRVAASAEPEEPAPVRPALTDLAVERAFARVQAGRDEYVYPGAALALGVRDRVHRIGAVGRQEWVESSEPVSADSTLYDLASLSKAVATTTAVMLLVDDGVIDLDQPVQRFLPDFQGQFKERVTFRHLLTHTSGLPAGTRLNGRTPAEVLRRLQRTLIPVPPGAQMVYSDIGFVVLWAAAERAAREPLPALLRRRVWEPLGMTRTRFLPGTECLACAPSLHLERGPRVPYRGQPADFTARRLGGITGNAGLFSTAHDLARFAAMMANGGELDGVRILSEAAVGEMLRQQPGAGNRSLGWHAYCPVEERASSEACLEPVAYGHTGFTGTAMLVDPQSGRWMVLLSNRTYLARAPDKIGALRAELWQALAE